MMQEIMRQIIADIAEDPARKDRHSSVPIVGKDKVCELVERCSENDKEGGRHDEAVAVHGEVVVDTVEEEVGGYTDTVVREVP